MWLRNQLALRPIPPPLWLVDQLPLVTLAKTGSLKHLMLMTSHVVAQIFLWFNDDTFRHLRSDLSLGSIEVVQENASRKSESEAKRI